MPACLVIYFLTIQMRIKFNSLKNKIETRFGKFLVNLGPNMYYQIKKLHSIFEIEDFVETHGCLQAVCDTPIARIITGCVSSLRI